MKFRDWYMKPDMNAEAWNRWWLTRFGFIIVALVVIAALLLIFGDHQLNC